MADAPPPPAPSYKVGRKWRGRRAIVEILAQRTVLNLNIDAAMWLGGPIRESFGG
jgi:hypothetical protein